MIVTRDKFSSKNWNEGILFKHKSAEQVSDVKTSVLQLIINLTYIQYL